MIELYPTKCCLSIHAMILSLMLLACQSALCQDTLSVKYQHMEGQYISDVNRKAESFNTSVERYTEKSLDRIIRQEKLMQKKVAKVDSVKARQLFAYSIDSLNKFKARIRAKFNKLSRFTGGGKYFPYLDTLKQSLGFLNKGSGIVDGAGKMQTNLNASMNSADEMQSKLTTANELDEYLQQRMTVLQAQLPTIPGIGSNLGNINKEAVYYKGQIEEYKSTLQDPDKLEKLALNTLEKLPAFQKYFQQNGQLASLFASPGGFPGNVGGSVPVVNGLPSRAAVQQFMQGSLPPASGQAGTQLIQQQAGSMSAGPDLDNLTDKLHGSGVAGDKDMPVFTPDGQHSKSLKKRLEFGANLQFGSSTNLLPTRGNLGLQIAYKLNDRSSVGVGATYTMGLGIGWNHIQFSSEAVGFRSFLKWKPKKEKNMYLQGGAEWNYLTQFSSIAALRNFSAWQTSAVAGIGKTFKVSKKLNGDLTLLYDFLYDRHIPVTQPLLFRVGYNF